MVSCLPFLELLHTRRSRNKCSSETSVMEEELPEFTIPGILSHLEVEDICKCACISRSWASWVHGGSIATRVLNERPKGISRRTGDMRLVKLLGKGIMARCEDQHFDGFTPLHFAVTGGYSQLVDALLASGVPIDVKDKYCQTPLHLAAQLGYDDLVQDLLNRGADINAKTTTYCTPLMRAAQHGHLLVVQILLEQGAAPNAGDEENGTSLTVAAAWGYPLVVEALISAGTDLSMRGLHGKTALKWARLQGHSAIAELLILAGAEVESPEDLDDEPPEH